MDAVKFLKERDRMCENHSCKECPIGKITMMGDCSYDRKEAEKIVEVVKNWSRENPDLIGKKYIIEIDKVVFDSVYKKTMLRVKGVELDGGVVWLDKAFIEQLAESEE